MAQIKLYRGGQQASLPLATEDGAIYIVQNDIDSTTGDIYTDFENQRLKIGTGSGGTFTKTTAQWAQNNNLVSAQGSIYIYSDARSYEEEVIEGGETVTKTIYVPGIKIGDGTSYVVDLPFVNVTAQQINFWNNKVTCYLASDLSASGNIEELVFSRS